MKNLSSQIKKSNKLLVKELLSGQRDIKTLISMHVHYSICGLIVKFAPENCFTAVKNRYGEHEVIWVEINYISNI